MGLLNIITKKAKVLCYPISMSPYPGLIARLDGVRFTGEPEWYIDLVKKGIGGFIVFGGRLDILREGLRYLQDLAEHPLIVGSDLEQGLGQQVAGGTVFPSAMAMASAYKKDSSVISLIEQAFRQIAREALYCGINTVFAPVMDLQSNAMNPIISIRSFGDEPEVASELGTLIIRVFRKEGVLSCAKHFPGHGDTEIDSHHGLPVVRRSLAELRGYELIPFKRAIDSGVSMIMMGHLLVPAIDPDYPASLSKRAVGFLRDMGFGGVIITDAINMGALSGYTELEVAQTAMFSGIDLILHPSDPGALARSLPDLKNKRVLFMRDEIRTTYEKIPDFEKGRLISRQIYEKALDPPEEMPVLRSPFLVILDEEISDRARDFIRTIGFGEKDFMYIKDGEALKNIPPERQLLLAVFTRPKAFKKKRLKDFEYLLKGLSARASLIISFGNPFVLKVHNLKNVVYVYDDTELAQAVVADFLRPFIHY